MLAIENYRYVKGEKENERPCEFCDDNRTKIFIYLGQRDHMICEDCCNTVSCKEFRSILVERHREREAEKVKQKERQTRHETPDLF